MQQEDNIRSRFHSALNNAKRILVCGVAAASDETELRGLLKRASVLKLDAVEWRVDYFAAESAEVIIKAAGIFGEFPEIAVIATFRDEASGGKIPSEAGYRLIVVKHLTRLFAAVDIDRLEGEEAVAEVINAAASSNCSVIVSQHDFYAISPEPDVRKLFAFAKSAGASAVKVFATAANETESLEFMFSCREICAEYPDLPAIFGTMGIGLLGRAAGISFGSHMTYGALGTPSANGQIDARLLKKTVDILYS